MPTEAMKDDAERDGDTKKAYAAVTTLEDRKSGPWGVLKKLATAFLKWDKTAKAVDRRELQNFVKLRLTAENVTWGNEVAFRDTFRRVIASSNQYDPARQDGGTPADAEKVFGDGDGRERSKAVRAAFMRALPAGATDEVVANALSLARGKKDRADA